MTDYVNLPTRGSEIRPQKNLSNKIKAAYGRVHIIRSIHGTIKTSQMQQCAIKDCSRLERSKKNTSKRPNKTGALVTEQSIDATNPTHEIEINIKSKNTSKETQPGKANVLNVQTVNIHVLFYRNTEMEFS